VAFLDAGSELHKKEQVNPRTGKAERVFVNLEACYPNPDDPSTELSFEELRAIRRGWMDRIWPKERLKAHKNNTAGKQATGPITEDLISSGTAPTHEETIIEPSHAIASLLDHSTPGQGDVMSLQKKEVRTDIPGNNFPDENQRLEDDQYGMQDGSRGKNHGRPKKLKLKEVKGETQIS
jgi:checkpoint serine/threonine-protein kinase